MPPKAADSSAAPSTSGTASTGASGSAIPARATDYRSPTVEDDDDDDDLDDLDDVLDSFNAPKSSLGKRNANELRDPPSSASPKPAGASAPGDAASAGADAAGANDEDFENSLMENMENLLRSLAVDHPPGPMADKAGASAGSPGAAGPSGAPAMSSEEEEAAFQKALEMMLSGEGMEAMGLGGAAKAGSAPKQSAAGKARAAGAGAGAGAAGATSFEDTIRKTMESLNAGGQGAPGLDADGMPGDLAALLQQLQSDPSALDGLGEDDDELGGLLDGMMAQLMSKEVLEEPMNELANKYPEYLANPPAGVSKEDLEKYKKQHELVKQITAAFARPGYSDDVDGKEVAKLVGEMQDLGGPPSEIMGDLPEGMDLGALGAGGDGCTIM